MPVENKYTNTDVAAGSELVASHLNDGAKLHTIFFQVDVAAADDDGSIYRIVKGLHPNAIIRKIEFRNTALTAGTVYDLGIYETAKANGTVGAVKNVNAFANDLDMSTASAGTDRNGTPALNTAALAKSTLQTLSGDTTVLTLKPSYDIAFTAATVGTAAGTIWGYVDYIQG